MKTSGTLKIARNGYIVMAVIFCALGIFLMANPEGAMKTICVLAGALFIADGIIKIIGYFSRDFYCLAFQFDLGFGILMIAMGVLILVRREAIFKLVFVVFGLLILADALLRIQMSVEAKKIRAESVVGDFNRCCSDRRVWNAASHRSGRRCKADGDFHRNCIFAGRNFEVMCGYLHGKASE